MSFLKTNIPGVLVFEPRVFADERGYFFESYTEKTFRDAGADIHWVQDNQSSSDYGVIRGLHFQLAPHAQTKLVRVISGRILDVVVDTRLNSPAYGQVYSVELSAENKKQILVPRGLAHGFSVLSEKAEVLYKCDAYYHKESESGIAYNDPELKIDWLIPADKQVLSAKDKELPLFRNHINNVIY